LAFGLGRVAFFFAFRAGFRLAGFFLAFGFAAFFFRTAFFFFGCGAAGVRIGSSMNGDGAGSGIGDGGIGGNVGSIIPGPVQPVSCESS
jgi:hypothetical protein